MEWAHQSISLICFLIYFFHNISVYVLKHIDLRKTPSLEFGMMIIFAYLPYGLAEGISLSGE